LGISKSPFPKPNHIDIRLDCNKNSSDKNDEKNQGGSKNNDDDDDDLDE